MKYFNYFRLIMFSRYTAILDSLAVGWVEYDSIGPEVCGQACNIIQLYFIKS